MSGKSTDKIKQWRQRVNAGDYDGVNEDIEVKKMENNFFKIYVFPNFN